MSQSSVDAHDEMLAINDEWNMEQGWTYHSKCSRGSYGYDRADDLRLVVAIAPFTTSTGGGPKKWQYMGSPVAHDKVPPLCSLIDSF